LKDRKTVLLFVGRNAGNTRKIECRGEKNRHFRRIEVKNNQEYSLHPNRKWFVLSTVLLGAALSALDISIVSVALPTLKRTLGVSVAGVEWVVISYVLALAVSLQLFRRLSVKYGRSRLYILGLAIFSSGSMFCGMSATAAILIASRVIQGLGAGLLQANSVALIREEFPSGQRGKAVGVQGVVQAAAMALGPLAGGLLIASAGWRAIFYLNVPIGIVGVIAALFILPRDAGSRESMKLDYMGAGLLAAGLAFLLLAVNVAFDAGGISQSVVVYFAAAVVLLSLFTVTELRAENPVIDFKLFRNGAFLAGNLTGMLSYCVLFAVMFLMPFYLERVAGYGVLLTGLVLTPLLLTMGAVAPLSVRVSDRYGPRIMTTMGIFISAFACLSLLLAGQSAGIAVLVCAVTLLGLGMGLFTPSNNSAIISSAPGGSLSMAGDILNTSRSLGLILGVNISGVMVTAMQHGYLAEKGYPHIHHVFSNGIIPPSLRDGAFMHGFVAVLVVLLTVDVLSALLSAFRKVRASEIIDQESAGAAVVSAGFFNGFGRESAGMSVFMTILLFAGLAGVFASPGMRGRSPLFPDSGPSASVEQAGLIHGHVQTAQDAETLALAYYAGKYGDRDVSVEVRPGANHTEEAYIRKNGFLVKKLSINGTKVTEKGTGLHDWAFDLLTNVN
jgi:EmrB/QacA subfamily drug resistance transporter